MKCFLEYLNMSLQGLWSAGALWTAVSIWNMKYDIAVVGVDSALGMEFVCKYRELYEAGKLRIL